MEKGRSTTGRTWAGSAVVALVVVSFSGCVGWNLPRIDPTGERFFIWPHEQPVGTVAGPPIATIGPTTSPFPPSAGVLGPTTSEPAPATLPPQTAVDPSGAPPPSTVRATPLWPDANAPAVFPHGLSGLGGCMDQVCPLPVGSTAVAPLAAAALPTPIDRVQITPGTVVAPVGSEVVLRAGICAENGFLVTGQPMEWMLDSAGVGQIVAVGQPTLLHHHRPQKIDNHYAVGRTSHHQSLLDRGTPQPDDDILIQEGETWLSVTSSIEGPSRVTAVAKQVESWQTRRATATIHWVDAQWVFPRSAANPVGESHVLTTRVTRLSDSRPAAGYAVRYELLDADVAGFAPDGAQVAEILTNQAGESSVELFPVDRRGATARVRVQVIRPSLAGSIGSPRLLLAGTTITKTWTAPDLVIQTTGPSQATVGAGVTYRIAVTNQGQLPATGATVAARLPAGLSFVASNPAAQEAPGRLTWTFESIEPGGTRTVLVDLRAEQAGRQEVCAAIQSAEGQSAENCAATEVIATTAILDIQIEGPETITVGEELNYVVTVTNRGNAPATDLVITDRFDEGLSHAMDPPPRKQAIEDRRFGDLAPGESRTVYITFDVLQAGRLCHEVEVANESGLRAVESVCVQAVAPAEPPPPEFNVTRVAPRQAIVGEEQTQIFKIVVENTGSVALRNLEIQERFEDYFAPRRATEGYQRVGSDTLTWTLEELPPGERRVYEVEYEMLRPTVGGPDARVTATVFVDEEQRTAEAAVEILPADGAAAPPPAAAEPPQPPPGPDVSLEVANLANPVRAGTRATFQVFLTNRGQESAFDVQPQVTFSVELGPVLDAINRALAAQNIQVAREGQVLRFTPIRELRPGDRVGFTLPFDAMQAGTATVEFTVTSRDMVEPLTYRDSVTVLPR